MLKFLSPKNFSGRSSYLKEWTCWDAASESDVKGVYIGELGNNYISALSPTVGGELLIHNRIADHIFNTSVNDYLNQIGFDKFYNRNPFKLSGGEQSVLAVICGVIYRAPKLGLDTTIEQLNAAWRIPLFELLTCAAENAHEIKISDNRIAEYRLELRDELITESLSSLGAIPPSFKKMAFVTRKLDWSSGSAISIDNLSFSYDRKNKILDDCSYNFESGHIYHLKGRNGAGKSTLSKILCGLLKPDRGVILLKGENFSFYKHPGKVLGYSFQNPDDQLFNKTVKAELIGSVAFQDQKFLDKFNFIAEVFGLMDLLESHPAELPFVIRKRISMAASLINEREWYVLDEPTIGQDDETIEEIRKIAEYLAGNGKGIIIISHCTTFINGFKQITNIELENGKLM